MNKIYHSIDEIHMDEERKEVIRENIIREYEKANQLVIRPHYQKSWKTAAAILVVLLLFGGSGIMVVAGRHFEFNRDFQSYLGINDQKEKKLQEDGIIQTPKIRDEHDGIIVEAERVIALDTECYVWLKITAPEKMRPLQNPLFFNCFGTDEIYHNGKPLTSWGISFVHKKQVSGPTAEDPWSTILWRPEEGITYVHYSLGLGKGEKTWDNSSLQLKLTDLVSVDNTIDKEEPTSIDAEHTWNLEIPVQVPDGIREYSMQYNCPITDPVLQRSNVNPQSILITKVRVHPFSIGIEFSKPYIGSDPDTIWSVGCLNAYEKKDGSIVTFQEEERSSFVQEKENGICEVHNICDYIDVENVAAIYLNETRIPLE